jgi:hypothetical protein
LHDLQKQKAALIALKRSGLKVFVLD